MNRKRYWASAALLAVVLISVWVWREYRVRNDDIDLSDNFRYLAYGRSLIENRHPNIYFPTYEEFSSGVENPSLAVYPNQLYSLSMAALCKALTVPPTVFALWPIWILNILATGAGFGFLFVLFQRFMPDRDAWLAMLLLWMSGLLMSTLVRPFSDVMGWGLTMALIWLAVCRRPAPAALGALFGAAVLFRMQLLFLLPFLIRLRQPEGPAKKLIVPFLKACAAAGCVLLAFEAVMHFYVRVPEGVARAETLGNASFYANDMRRLFSNFGNLKGAVLKVARVLGRLLNPISAETIGLAWLLSLGVWLYKPVTVPQKQARTLWLAAVCGTLLPLLVYGSENQVIPPNRYQIYSIPFFMLTAFAALNHWPAFSGNKIVRLGLRSLLVVLAAVALVSFGRQRAMLGKPYYAGLHAIYADFENLPQLLRRLNMPADGVYLVKPTLQAFLPDSRMIRLPAQDDFKAGARNQELDGIITKAKRQKRWETFGPVVEDDRGVRFVRVYAGRGNGGLLIYKREAAAPKGRPAAPGG